jgi:hypothetical protein
MKGQPELMMDLLADVEITIKGAFVNLENIPDVEYFKIERSSI